MGSLAGAVRPREDIEGALRLTQVGQESTVEGKAKSQPDWILHHKISRGESRA